MAALLKLIFILLLALLVFGCSGSGCQKDTDCKANEYCSKDSCISCIGVYEKCDPANECCPGTSCISGLCRYQDQVLNNGTDANTTAAQNDTSDTDINVPSGLQVFDLPEGRQAELGGMSIKVSEITENLVYCSVENETARLLVTLRNSRKEFALKAGESASIGNVNITVLNIPCTVSESETECALWKASSLFESKETLVSESVLGKTGRVNLPGGAAVEILGVDELGDIPEYWRTFEFAQGESTIAAYSYLGGQGYLELMTERIDETTDAQPAGQACNVTSRRARIKVRTSGFPEFYASAAEGETADANLHKIKIEKISESLFPSDGNGCSVFNKTVLLNVSFPNAYRNIRVHMLFYSGGDSSEMTVESTKPWTSGDLQIEVSPSAQDSTHGSWNTFNLRATATKRKTAVLSEGGQASISGVSLALDSVLSRVVDAERSCFITDTKERINLSEGDYSVKKEIAIGEAVSMPSGASFRLLGVDQGLERNVKSCRITLKRAVIAVTQK